MATGTSLPCPSPARTPPAAPSSKNHPHTLRLPNRSVSGTSSTEASAMGSAPIMVSRDWDAPHAPALPKKVLSTTHLQ